MATLSDIKNRRNWEGILSENSWQGADSDIFLPDFLESTSGPPKDSH